jgi:hypothetical protein
MHAGATDASSECLEESAPQTEAIEVKDQVPTSHLCRYEDLKMMFVSSKDIVCG